MINLVFLSMFTKQNKIRTAIKPGGCPSFEISIPH